MSYIKNEKGFGLNGVVVALLVIAVLGITGYIVIGRSKSDSSKDSSRDGTELSTNSKETAEKETSKTYTTPEDRDKNRKEDLDAIVAQIKNFFKNKKRYPTQDEFLNATWRSANGFTLTKEQVQDPSATGDSESLIAYEIGKNGMGTIGYQPIVGQYIYNPTDPNGNTCKNENSDLGYGGNRTTIDSCTLFTFDIPTEKYYDSALKMYQYSYRSF